MPTRINEYKIQARALNSVKTDFAKAANKKRRKLATSFANALNNPLAENLQLNDRYPWGKRPEFESWGNDLGVLQFMEKGMQGKYDLFNDQTQLRGLSVWQDYLKEIDRLAYGFGCIPRNKKTIEGLIKQNGPKKMEQRLTRFLKRQIARRMSW